MGRLVPGAGGAEWQQLRAQALPFPRPGLMPRRGESDLSAGHMSPRAALRVRRDWGTSWTGLGAWGGISFPGILPLCSSGLHGIVWVACQLEAEANKHHCAMDLTLLYKLFSEDGTCSMSLCYFSSEL